MWLCIDGNCTYFGEDGEEYHNLNDYGFTNKELNEYKQQIGYDRTVYHKAMDKMESKSVVAVIVVNILWFFAIVCIASIVAAILPQIYIFPDWTWFGEEPVPINIIVQRLVYVAWLASIYFVSRFVFHRFQEYYKQKFRKRTSYNGKIEKFLNDARIQAYNHGILRH